MLDYSLLHKHNADEINLIISDNDKLKYEIQLGDEKYSYDKVGNRLSTVSSKQDWLYNANNQLTRADNISYEYDLNGNQIRKIDNKTNQTTYYIYNSEQRLIRLEDNERQIIAQYTYNPFGQRVSKNINGITTYFLYSQEGLVAEYSQTGQLKTEYHYQPNSTWMTNPLFMRNNFGEVLYYYNDHLGTPQALYNKQGQQKWQANYSAFGQAEIINNLVTQNLRFSGQYYDDESGLHQNFFRDYDPRIGRYIQTDPIGLRGGINTYAYVGGNPLVFIDPFGLVLWSGEFHSRSAVVVGGVVWMEFELTSECVDGQKAHVKVTAKALSVGTKGVSETYGTISFQDHQMNIDPSNLEGSFGVAGVGASVGGEGVSSGKIRIGDAWSRDSETTGGFDVGIGVGFGYSDITSIRYEDCICDE